MKLVYGARQSGKTTRAIELANEQHAHLVVRNRQMAEMYQDNVTHRVFTHDDIRSGKHERYYPRKLVIDDAECLLERMTSATIETAVMTAESGEQL